MGQYVVNHSALFWISNLAFWLTDSKHYYVLLIPILIIRFTLDMHLILSFKSSHNESVHKWQDNFPGWVCNDIGAAPTRARQWSVLFMVVNQPLIEIQ